jgi:hypothetical protein
MYRRLQPQCRLSDRFAFRFVVISTRQTKPSAVDA